ncbi:MAG: hypothetical protein QG657_806, partial [Acidobacteriota bacterium]|nr:hypothetical protein [Acidobacteriota bacterium]
MFSNDDLINFFREKGLGIIIDKNGKVFPRTGNSRDVLGILINECKNNNVRIVYNEAVLKIEKREPAFWIKTKDNEYLCPKLVISTGGKSYPSSGSSGDGYGFAKDLGHTVVSPKPALTPVFIKDYQLGEIAGVSLQNRTVYLYRDNKKVKEHRGDIGFTHNGLSGPGILDFSRYMEKKDILKIDFANRKAEAFAREFIEAAEKEGKISIGKFLKGYDIPVSLVRIILCQLNLDRNEKLANINKSIRNRLVDSFCQYPFVIENIGGFDIAMVTKGGISLNEVSAKTMESKKVRGLFFAGEVLDIDGDTGGYNIQAAFSTGYLAALSATDKK